MQIDKKDYNPDEHEIYKALTVRQPYADLLTEVLVALMIITSLFLLK